jgi:hypothetical protein
MRGVVLGAQAVRITGVCAAAVTQFRATSLSIERYIHVETAALQHSNSNTLS